MLIATIDIGGTGIKFAAMSKEGGILEKQELATPDNLGDLPPKLSVGIHSTTVSANNYIRLLYGF